MQQVLVTSLAQFGAFHDVARPLFLLQLSTSSNECEGQSRHWDATPEQGSSLFFVSNFALFLSEKERKK